MYKSIDQIVLSIKSAINSSPTLFSIFGPINENPDFYRRVVRKNDDVVIEGFPRSANTFATYAFCHAQPNSIKIGNHFHSGMQIQLADRYKVPALVVYREPRAAIKSFIVYHLGKVSARQAIYRYIDFHESILKTRNAFVAAPFEEVTSDFGLSIDRLNAVFKTSFSRFEHHDDNVDAVYARIKQKKDARNSGNSGSDSVSARSTTPSKRKSELAEKYGNWLQDKSLIPLLERADLLYKEMENIYSKQSSMHSLNRYLKSSNC